MQLRTLTIDESDVWLRRLTGAVDVELGETEGDAEALADLLALPARAVLDLVAAYDVDGVRGEPASLRTRMTKRELHDALDAMAGAEDPFREGAVRLVDEVFGAPSRFLATMTSLVIDGLATAPSPNGASAAGVSTGSVTSDPAGAVSASSSSGRTATNGNGKTRRRSAKRSRTG